jgi:threonylcarbamoyladenosine tRNA methylthiotransferase MtaB
MPTIRFRTLGCKVNQYDTQSIRERFLSQGFEEAVNKSAADIYLINTCTVTSSADRKSRSVIRKCIRENPKAKVIVTGCMAINDRDALAKIQGVSLIISRSFFSEGVADFCGHTRAFLKIQDGCDNFCSYCKVPLVRGRSRSRPFQEVIREGEILAAKGFKEIVLTGICLGDYGRDTGAGIDLVKVIEELEKLKTLSRIRLSSIEAGDVTNALINKMAGSKKLCSHLHIPIQSGDDEILKKMKRKYSRKFYLGLIDKIKKKVPGVSITTDCLVGFPGESEKCFQNTLSLIKQIVPLRTHIFPYSPRKGTNAFRFAGENDKALIERRCSKLKEAAEECGLSYRKLFLSKTVDVLIEGKVKKDPDFWQGYTSSYIMVLVKSKCNLKNRIIPLRLEKLKDDFIVGSKRMA